MKKKINTLYPIYITIGIIVVFLSCLLSSCSDISEYINSIRFAETNYISLSVGWANNGKPSIEYNVSFSNGNTVCLVKANNNEPNKNTLTYCYGQNYTKENVYSFNNNTFSECNYYLDKIDFTSWLKFKQYPLPKDSYWFVELHYNNEDGTVLYLNGTRDTFPSDNNFVNALKSAGIDYEKLKTWPK